MSKLNKKILLLIAFVCLYGQGKDVLSAQNGGYSFEFLNMGQSARVAALGSEFIAVDDADITVALSNPSFISPAIHSHIALNYVNYFGGINYGFASYSHTFRKAGSFTAHLQYGNYGKIKVVDEFDNENGEASANDLALILGWGRTFDSCFSIGANLKMIYSNIAGQYSAFGMGVDVAATYTNPSKLFSVSLLLRNMGGAIKRYTDEPYTHMPFEVGIALSQKIPKAPLRLFLEAHDLQKWKLNYDNPYAEKDLATGELKTRSKAADFFDNFARHLIIGLEIIPYKGFYLRLGYNYNRSMDMITPSKPGVIGLSYGFGFRIYKFHFSYSRSEYHRAGSPNYITFSMDINAVSKKK